jgi:hypothetical protein
MTSEPTPPPTDTNGTSTIGMPARTTMSSVHQSVPMSCGLRSPGTGAWAELGSDIAV